MVYTLIFVILYMWEMQYSYFYQVLLLYMLGYCIFIKRFIINLLYLNHVETMYYKIVSLHLAFNAIGIWCHARLATNV